MKKLCKHFSSPRKVGIGGLSKAGMICLCFPIMSRKYRQIFEELPFRSRNWLRSIKKIHCPWRKKLGVFEFSEIGNSHFSIGREHSLSPNQTCQGDIRFLSGRSRACYDQRHCCERKAFWHIVHFLNKGKSTFTKELDKKFWATSWESYHWKVPIWSWSQSIVHLTSP